MVGKFESAAERDTRPIDPKATTLMLRNIPNKVKLDHLHRFLDDTPVRGTYDIVHLPIDFKSGHNRGYAFVNFRSNELFLQGLRELQGLRFAAMSSQKVTDVSVAHIQGKKAIEQIQQPRPGMANEKGGGKGGGYRREDRGDRRYDGGQQRRYQRWNQNGQE
mmetsp:Transcript_43518/g.114836  ORF Transcript_43518/g.114836 Transcript_43518/m.114836 type:complete len:162 (+) Transcript_43518:103-588(+)